MWNLENVDFPPVIYPHGQFWGCDTSVNMWGGVLSSLSIFYQILSSFIKGETTEPWGGKELKLGQQSNKSFNSQSQPYTNQWSHFIHKEEAVNPIFKHKCHTNFTGYQNHGSKSWGKHLSPQPQSVAPLPGQVLGGSNSNFQQMFAQPSFLLAYFESSTLTPIPGWK